SLSSPKSSARALSPCAKDWPSFAGVSRSHGTAPAPERFRPVTSLGFIATMDPTLVVCPLVAGRIRLAAARTSLLFLFCRFHLQTQFDHLAPIFSIAEHDP